MDRHVSRGIRAERHRLLGNPHRLAIVEALEEAPREISELARLLGVHPTTVRDHLGKLLEAGVHPIIVAQRLGHSTPSLVMNTYGHVTPRMQEQATAALGKILHA